MLILNVMCRVWWSEKVQTIDCGEEAATWFSQYILGKDSGARLGYYLQENSAFRRDISKVKLSAFQQHYKKLRNRDVVSQLHLRLHGRSVTSMAIVADSKYNSFYLHMFITSTRFD